MGVNDLGALKSRDLSADRMDELFARNTDIITPEEQAALAASRTLVAGCGSVGGSLIESLVRLGATQATLADPEVFDLSNINRQACSLADIGRPKATVLAERALAINPFFNAKVYSEGLTDGNIEEALDGVTIAFDAIDASTSPWIKYRLHQLAVENSIPVVSGFDYGGKACLYIFDYRRSGSTPFYGRASAEAHRTGDLAQCLKWLGYRHFPTDFLGVIQDRIGSGKPWPQVTYCVMAMGALGTRSVVDLMMNRRVPHVVSFDVHDRFRRLPDRLAQRLHFPMALIRAYRAARGGPRGAACSDGDRRRISPALLDDFVLRKVLEAMIQAPSPHNCQPWKFVISGTRKIEVSWDRARAIPAVDPDNFSVAYSLGCAVECASLVADIDFTPSSGISFDSPEYSAGTLRIHGLPGNRYTRGFALLAHRRTYRGRMRDVPHSKGLAIRCDQVARTFGARAVFLRVDDDSLFRLALVGARKLLGRPDYFSELLSYMRLCRSESDEDPTGFTRESLGLSRIESELLRLFRRSRAIRNGLCRLGLAEAMARSAIKGMKDHREFVLVSTSQWTDAGRVNAGRALMRVWLELTDSGLHCQPVDFPISNEGGRRAVASIFGLPANQRPIVLLRVGRASATPPSASRRPLASFCEVASSSRAPDPVEKASEETLA